MAKAKINFYSSVDIQIKSQDDICNLIDHLPEYSEKIPFLSVYEDRIAQESYVTYIQDEDISLFKNNVCFVNVEFYPSCVRKLPHELGSIGSFRVCKWQKKEQKT